MLFLVPQTKDPDLGAIFLRIGITCLFYNSPHIIYVTEDQFYLFLITYLIVFHLWI